MVPPHGLELLLTLSKNPEEILDRGRSAINALAAIRGTRQSGTFSEDSRLSYSTFTEDDRLAWKVMLLADDRTT